MIKTSEEKQH